MGFTGALEDRLAIRELMERYDDAVARVDAEAWGETWAPDAEWELMGRVVRGRDAIVGLWQETMAQFDLVIFRTAPGAIEVAGQVATGRALAHEILQTKGGGRRHVHGRYDDSYVKIGEVWHFQTRRYQVLAAY